MVFGLELLKILVCPKCRRSVKLDCDAVELLCLSCGLCYKIKGHFPIMLVDKASSIKN